MIGKTQSLTKLPGLPFRQVMLDSAPLGAHKSVETKGFCLLPGFMRSLGLIGAWAGLSSLASQVPLFANLSTELLSTIFFRVIFWAPQTSCKLCKAKIRAGKVAREQNVADCSDNRQLNIFSAQPEATFLKKLFSFLWLKSSLHMSRNPTVSRKSKFGFKKQSIEAKNCFSSFKFSLRAAAAAWFEKNGPVWFISFKQ